MPTTLTPIQILDDVFTRSDRVKFSATFDMPAGWELLVEVKTSGSGANKTLFCPVTEVNGPQYPRGTYHTYLRLGPGATPSVAFLAAAMRYPGAVPRLASVSARVSGGPTTGAKLVPVVYQAWHEAYGRPVPADEDVADDLKAGKGSKQAADQAALDLLRSGPAGVKKWNKKPDDERAGTRLAGADLKGCDLSGAKLTGVILDRADLSGAKLTGADLSSHFTRPALKQMATGLKGAKLVGADLTGANLGGCNCQEADFTRADLTGANVRAGRYLRAKFDRANLTDADFSFSHLEGADFSTATLSGNEFDRATFDEKTRWPAGFALLDKLIWKGAGPDPRKPVVKAKVQGKLPGMGDDFVDGLRAACDGAKLSKALSMLKAERFQLFAEVAPTHVCGVVRSQSSEKRVYACRLASDGRYSCCTQNLIQCVVSRGSPCKHLLVLVVGLVKAGQLDGPTALEWLRRARRQGLTPDGFKPDKEVVTATFLRYKGVEAGEVDWRPTETIPEDFYAM
jgi:uncharacterized protein YjbI with pentapeptide repeats